MEAAAEQTEKPKIIDTPGAKSFKIWSEKLQRYYYKNKDKKYYTDYYHKTKQTETCEFCKRTVSSQLKEHQKSLVRKAAQQRMELLTLKNEIEFLKAKQ